MFDTFTVSGPVFVLVIPHIRIIDDIFNMLTFYIAFKVGGVEAEKNPGPSCFGLCPREPLPFLPGGVQPLPRP